MGLRRLAQIALPAVLCSLYCAPSVDAASPVQFSPYISGQYFTWSEFSNGRRLLKESGALYAGGLLVDAAVPLQASSSLVLRAKEEIFGGVVDYDGETQEQVPVKTKVSYLGTKQELDLGYRYEAQSWDLGPRAGLGYRWWLRGLQNSTSAAGEPVSGYTEYWRIGYLRLGARGHYRPETGISLFAEGGAKYPFYIANSADPFGTGAKTFRPGGRWSGYAEAGVTYGQLRLSASYEGFRFSPSPVVFALHGGVLEPLRQPESSSDLLGLNLGWTF
jgi:hypothetical protein